MKPAVGQLDLFGGIVQPARKSTATAPYQPSSDTSKAAAESIAPEVPKLEAMVLQMLVDHPLGLINRDIASLSHEYGRPMPEKTVCPRTNWLAGGRGRDKPKGPALIEKSGVVDGCTVWRITPMGRQALLEHERERVARITKAGTP